MKVVCTCGKTLRVNDALAGKTIRCPACKGVLKAEKAPEEIVEIQAEAEASPPVKRMPARDVDDAPTPARKRAPVRDEQEEDRPRRPKKRKKKAAGSGALLWVALGGVVAVAAVVVAVVAFWPPVSRPNPGGQSGNGPGRPAGGEGASADPTILGKHAERVFDLTFTPDGKTVISAGSDGTIKLWDVTSRTLKKTLSGHTSEVDFLALSADGKTLASGSKDGTVKLWDVETEADRATLRVHSGGVEALAMTRDGKILATGSAESAIKLWDIPKGKLLKTIPLHEGERSGPLAFSPDGRLLVNGVGLTVRDIPSGSPRPFLKDGTIMDAGSLALSPDGTRLFTTAKSGNLNDLSGAILWDFQTSKQIVALKGVNEFFLRMCVSEDSRRFAMGGMSKSGGRRPVDILVWNLQPRRAFLRIKGHLGMVSALALSPDGRLLVSAGDDNVIRLRDLDAMAKKQESEAGQLPP